MRSKIHTTAQHYFNNPLNTKQMKTYQIKLLTQKGLITVIYKDNQDLEAFELEILKKYGQFTTLSSKLI